MSLLRRFNPYGLPDDVVDALATGREAVLHDLLAEIDKNLTRRPVQHALLLAPRGFGKSFLMRMVQNRLRERESIGFVLLPEEQPNVRRPALLLQEIRRVFEGRPASDVGIRRDLGPKAWDEAVAALDAAIVERLGPNGLLVVAVENFDELMDDVFDQDCAAMALRGLLTRDDGRLMLLATSTRPVDADHEKPLFEAFTPFSLRLWEEADVLAFFDRIREEMHEPPLNAPERARTRAISMFAGGSPRIATVLYEVLATRDADNAATALDALIDELSDYYRERVKRLSRRARDVLDTLLRHGEPKSQTELAALLGEEGQSRIGEPFRELLAEHVVCGVRAANSSVGLYQVTDRLFAYFYRVRYFDPEGHQPKLERIAEFLADFFTADEKRAEAEKLRAAGRAADAAVYDRLLMAPRHLLLDVQHAGKLDRSRPAPERLAAAEIALRLAREASDSAAEIEALFDIAEAYLDLKQHAAAIATLREALACTEATGDRREQAKALRWIGWSQGKMGEHATAIATLREAIAHAEAAGDRGEQAAALRNIGWSQGEMGEHAAAIATLREAVAHAEAAGDRREQALALASVFLSAHQSGTEVPSIAGDFSLLVELSANRTDVDGLPSIYLDDAAAVALRARVFPALWQVVSENPERFTKAAPTLIARGAAEAVSARFEKAGRAAAYADAASLIDTLAGEARFPPGDGLSAASLLRAVAGALAREISDPPLLRDIAALLERHAPDPLATEIALLRARALDLEHPDDPAALERTDPDIAAAVRRVRGISDAVELFRRGKPKTLPGTRKRNAKQRREST